MFGNLAHLPGHRETEVFVGRIEIKGGNDGESAGYEDCGGVRERDRTFEKDGVLIWTNYGGYGVHPRIKKRRFNC